MRELKVLGAMGYAYDYAEHPLSALAYLKREGLAEVVSQAKTRHGLSRTWGLTERGLAEYRKLRALSLPALGGAPDHIVDPNQMVPEGIEGMREKVARIIAPNGWRTFDDEVRDCKFWGEDLNPPPKAHRFLPTADSLSKADAILEAISQHPVRGET